jgi:Ca2+-binding EF-hand superfamily protein
MASNQYDSQASTNYKEAFSLFDKRGNGRVTLESLGDLLRACGQNPTMTEIRDLEKNIGGDCMQPLSTLIYVRNSVCRPATDPKHPAI